MAAGILPNTAVEWLQSQKRQPLLSIDGYLFTNSGNGKIAGVRYWKCSAFKSHNCQVSAKTVGPNVVQLNGVLNPPDHGHINDAAKTTGFEFRVSQKLLSFAADAS